MPTTTTTPRHRYLQWVYLMHAALFAPLLIGVGVFGSRDDWLKKYLLPNRWAFSALALTGFAALGYHAYWYVDSLKRAHGD